MKGAVQIWLILKTTGFNSEIIQPRALIFLPRGALSILGMDLVYELMSSLK